MRLGSLVALLAAAIAVAGCSSDAQARRQVPRGFMGVLTGYPMENLSPARTDAELGTMAGAGVETVRIPLYWVLAQPYATAADVPSSDRSRFADVGGRPTSFALFDGAVLAAARAGMDVLPSVLGTPEWARRNPANSGSSPRDPQDFARFLTAAVQRYGPRGTLWSQNPSVPRHPIRVWQMWNEPDHLNFWLEQPYYRRYVDLLAASRRAIKAQDPGAKVVLAGLVGRSWTQLAALYRAGAKRNFDFLGVHPFTRLLPDVVRILRYNREVATSFGDGAKPMVVTELTWPSSKGRIRRPSSFDRTERNQASLLDVAFRVLANNRVKLGIRNVFWATWLTSDRSRTDPFDYTGLSALRGNGTIRRKPAFLQYRATAKLLEGCAKVAMATRCR